MTDNLKSYEELREAALQMQVAVGNVLSNGGINIDGWWNELVKAQRNLASVTRGKSSDFDKYRVSTHDR